jgi:hypothetical protein
MTAVAKMTMANARTHSNADVPAEVRTYLDRRAAPSTAPVERLALTIAAFCQATGLGRSFVFQEIQRGRLKARKAGSRTVILPHEGDEYLRSLPFAHDVDPDAESVR